MIREDVDASGHEQPSELLGDESEVADPGRRDVERGDRPHVGFESSQLGEGELGDVDAVVATTPCELGQARELVGPGGDHDLATHLVRKVVGAAERDRLAVALHGETRLEAAGRVVQPGMDDVGVVARLMRGRTRARARRRRSGAL